ncbi:MAG: hypothetical protein IJL76_02505 [Bacilli bacterium]|nr:hypothetical protein [Bacilli bacterium]
MQFFDNKGSNYNSEQEDIVFENDGQEVEANKKNQEYYQKLMDESGSKKSDYYDKKDPLVRLILLVLAIIIIVGTVFIIMRGTG